MKDKKMGDDQYPPRPSLIREGGMHVDTSGNIRRAAFTLAEVLITLGIIGVVASLTIPSVISQYREKQTVVKLKKAYSVLYNAFLLAKQKHGTADEWNLISPDSPEGSNNALNILAENMKILKFCGNNKGCFPDMRYKALAGGTENNYNTMSTGSKLILSDGSLIYLSIRNSACQEKRSNQGILQETCGVIMIDINGEKAPNQFGRDTFWFAFAKEGIIPHGTQNATGYTFENHCKDKSTASGFGCTAWVLYNENLDYLHCSDLNWNTKNKCKS